MVGVVYGGSGWGRKLSVGLWSIFFHVMIACKNWWGRKGGFKFFYGMNIAFKN